MKRILAILAGINIAVLVVCTVIYESQKGTDDWAGLVYGFLFLSLFISLMIVLAQALYSVYSSRKSLKASQAKLRK